MFFVEGVCADVLFRVVGVSSSFFCNLQARLRSSGLGAIVDELTELTTSKMAQVQETVVAAKMDVLNHAVEKAQTGLPKSAKQLFEEIRVGSRLP